MQINLNPPYNLHLQFMIRLSLFEVNVLGYCLTDTGCMPDEACDGRNVALKWQLEVKSQLLACLIVQNNNPTINSSMPNNFHASALVLIVLLNCHLSSYCHTYVSAPLILVGLSSLSLQAASQKLPPTLSPLASKLISRIRIAMYQVKERTYSKTTDIFTCNERQQRQTHFLGSCLMEIEMMRWQ